MNNYFDNLNPEQIKAVTTTNGPVLTLSGAGTGKTRVLTARIAHILHNNLAYPWQILALTFTNKAANEMRNRIATFIDSGVKDIWMGTFHSVCLRILQSNCNLVGLQQNILIYDEDDQKALLKNVISNMGLDIKQYAPSEWVDIISRIKDSGNINYKTLSPTTKKIIESYNAELKKVNAIDFGDIILYVLQLFQDNPDLVQKYQNQFKYILVDEFQDTNSAQMMFLKLLTKDKQNPNIFCVGDDDQSIYSWRGAEIKNILEFEHTYKNTTIIRLETNYRSSGNILGAANSLIEHNTERLGKNLKCHRTDSMGHPVYILTFPTEWNEASFIADSILSDYKNNLSGCAVLIRSSILSRVFEEEFTSKNIPFKLIGATKFYDRAEIRDVIAYIRLLVYPNDNISFMRIISKPRRGFGISTLEKLHAKFDSYMAGLKSENLNTKQKKTATEFINVFDIDWQNMSPVSVVQQLLENSGYLNMWRESKEPDAQERLEHIQDLVSNVIAKYDSLPEFLEYAALMTSEEDNNNFGTDAVSIMTMHASKGLEFDVVYLPAWEENIFPNEKSVREGGIEEERRLGYVSITRAKQVLVISNAASRSVYGQRTYNLPSRFIDELDKRYLRCFGSEQYTTYTNKSAEPQKIIQKKKYLGKKVSHEELGVGTVVAEDGDVLTIAFNTRGIKKVMAGFVKII